jgi:hypothetical protein
VTGRSNARLSTGLKVATDQATDYATAVMEVTRNGVSG